MDFSLLFSSPVLTWDAVPMINPRRRTYGSDCSTCSIWPSNPLTQSQQQLLLRAFTPPQPLASGVIHWGTHIPLWAFVTVLYRWGGGTVPGQLQVAVPCLLSSRTVSMTVIQKMVSFHLWGRHLFLLHLDFVSSHTVCPIASSCNQQCSEWVERHGVYQSRSNWGPFQNK